MKIPFSHWMWTPDWTASLEESPVLVCFRRQFTYHCPDAGKEKPTDMEISADSRYKLYVNGRYVHSGPRKGDNQVWFYDTIDLSPYLREGENVLAVVVLRYPRIHQRGNHSVWRTEMPGLYVTAPGAVPLTMEPDPDSGEAAGLQSSWKTKILTNVRIVSESPYFAPLQILEEAVGCREMAGWMNAGFDESSWSSAVFYPAFSVSQAVSPGNLLPRPVPLMENTPKRFLGVYCVREGALGSAAWNAMLRGGGPITIAAGSRQIVEIDAGELETGFLKLVMKGGNGARIRILTSECYAYPPLQEGMMALPVKGDRTDCVNGRLYGFTDTYTVDGYGRDDVPEIYEPYWFRTFRYVQLDISTGPEALHLCSFDYTETGYPLEVTTQITTDDPEMNAIWDLSLRTLRRCMYETYEDCPFYEQLQYAMDTRSQILFTYCVSGDDRLARICIDDFARSQRYDGLINCSYPCYGPNVIPGFSIYYILMIYDHMMYFADEDLVRRYMPAAERILDYFERNLDERGLVGKIGGVNGRDRYWSFIDWAIQWNETTGVPAATLQGPITMESFLYAYGLQHGAKMMDFLGRTQDRDIYEARAAKVLSAIQKYCLGANGLYQDGPGIDEYSQHAQVFAVLTGLAEGEEAKRILLETLSQDAPYAKCSVAMAFYLFRAMETAGLYEQTGCLWEPWREMVRNHLTTCVENDVDSRSDCHAWGAAILYEIPAVMLGVRPTKPGFKDYVPTPVKGPVSGVRGRVGIEPA